MKKALRNYITGKMDSIIETFETDPETKGEMLELFYLTYLEVLVADEKGIGEASVMWTTWAERCKVAAKGESRTCMAKSVTREELITTLKAFRRSVLGSRRSGTVEVETPKEAVHLFDVLGADS